MSDNIKTIEINPFHLKVIDQKREGSMLLNYHNDILSFTRTIFYLLLRLLKLNLTEYRKFNFEERNNLLNIYFRLQGNKQIWLVDITKQQETFRVLNGKGVQCVIYQVLSVRKKPKEPKEKKEKTLKISKTRSVKDYKKYPHSSSEMKYLDEHPLTVSLIFVVISFLLYFIFRLIGNS